MAKKGLTAVCAGATMAASLVLVAPGGAAAAASAGSAASQEGQRGPHDACGDLTSAQVIAATGAPITVVGHSAVVLNSFWYSPPVKLASCSWTDANTKAAKFGILQLAVARLPTPVVAASYFHKVTISTTEGVGWRQVTGIGTKALLLPEGPLAPARPEAAEIAVLQGALVLGINLAAVLGGKLNTVTRFVAVLKPLAASVLSRVSR
jgi:hypothetical protein